MTILRPATEADIPFIMATERVPGFEWVVGQWDDATHLAAMAQADTAYFIGERNGAPLGFAILLHVDDRWGNVLLKRIAVREPGAGFGRVFLDAVLRWTFARPKPYRLWLTVAPHNPRARHLYQSLGFRDEGVMRDAHVDPEGRRFSPFVMSVLRPEWEARQVSGVGAPTSASKR